LAPFFTGGPLGGDVQIYGWDLEVSQYWHLPKDLILLVNAEASVVDYWGDGPDPITLTDGVTTVSAVPIFDRLFLGGANNLRGFDYHDVSPKDERGEPIGGNSMARATVELTFPIIEKARGALFYDVGFVNIDAYDFSIHTVVRREKHSGMRPNGSPRPDRLFYDDNLASDIGFGLRLDLPIGPLRIDFAFPVDRAGNPPKGKFQFNVGYQF
jgi:outer membrane protein insertion porin family